jgi:hypothetical protein
MDATFAIVSTPHCPILPDGKHLRYEMYRVFAVLLAKKRPPAVGKTEHDELAVK